MIWDPNKHPRDHGKFAHLGLGGRLTATLTEKLAKLRAGAKIALPGGPHVIARHHVTGAGVIKRFEVRNPTGPTRVKVFSTEAQAAAEALTRSVRSSHPKSLGNSPFDSLDHLALVRGRGFKTAAEHDAAQAAAAKFIASKPFARKKRKRRAPPVEDMWSAVENLAAGRFSG